MTNTDAIYILEIILMEKKCIHTATMLNHMTKDFETMDNPSYKPMVDYSAVASGFNNFLIFFEPPTNKHKITGHADLPTNNNRRMEIVHGGMWVRMVFEH
mmetsp:Transcript_42352/g.83191  ORF Transcript_42352/g.83191 Transcript_42352/m.83191 type:complete len:100 (+) Transcript_42352:72-371(+)